jgi:hypothetical protein
LDVPKAKRFAAQARVSNPYSPSAHMMYAAVHWQEKANEQSKEELDSMIEEAKITLEIAIENFDNMNELLARNSLAYLLRQRYEFTRQEQDIKSALDEYRVLQSRFESIEKDIVPACYNTYARVLSAKDDLNSLTMALGYADKAGERAPKSSQPDLTKAYIKEKIQRLGLRFEEKNNTKTTKRRSGKKSV